MEYTHVCGTYFWCSFCSAIACQVTVSGLTWHGACGEATPLVFVPCSITFTIMDSRLRELVEAQWGYFEAQVVTSVGVTMGYELLEFPATAGAKPRKHLLVNVKGSTEAINTARTYVLVNLYDGAA